MLFLSICSSNLIISHDLKLLKNSEILEGDFHDCSPALDSDYKTDPVNTDKEFFNAWEPCRAKSKTEVYKNLVVKYLFMPILYEVGMCGQVGDVGCTLTAQNV